jgi:hypothetical protein
MPRITPTHGLARSSQERNETAERLGEPRTPDRSHITAALGPDRTMVPFKDAHQPRQNRSALSGMDWRTMRGPANS